MSPVAAPPGATERARPFAGRVAAPPAAAPPTVSTGDTSTVPPRIGKAKGPTETVKRSSVPPAMIIEENERSAPRPAPIPRELAGLLAEAQRTPLPETVGINHPEHGDATPSSAPPIDMPVVGEFGDYEIYGRLAFGGMAEIFLAREAGAKGMQRQVVIKKILPHVVDDDQFVQMFLDEARLAIRLAHPNICHIYEFGRQDGSYFIAMEFVNGVSLEKLNRRARSEGGIPVPISVKIISHIAEALHYAHRARDERGRPLGIVHRDVSPQNIMISYDAAVKLLDFGVAKAASQGTKTQAGTVKGKFAYMSPQQCVGKDIDARADVFSLGICLYEAISGGHLYHRPTEYETMKVIVDGEVPSIRAVKPEVPEALDAIIQKALAKSPDDRFQTAGEMSNALERWLGGTGEVVGATRLSDYMEKLYAEDIKRGPKVDPSIATGRSRIRTIPEGNHVIAAHEIDISVDLPSERPPPKRAVWPWVAGLAALLLVAGGGAWFTVGPGATRPAPHTPRRAGHVASGATPPVLPTTPSTPTQPTTPTSPTGPVSPEVGTVAAASTPGGAHVLLDGIEVPGTTPVNVSGLTPGEHVVTLTRSGFHDWSGHVVVAAGGLASVTATLVAHEHEPTGPPAHLSINTHPWSKVYLGNTLLGTTPIGSVTVRSGTLRLRLVDRDGNTHSQVVHVEPGGTAHVSLDFNGAH